MAWLKQPFVTKRLRQNESYLQKIPNVMGDDRKQISSSLSSLPQYRSDGSQAGVGIFVFGLYSTWTPSSGNKRYRKTILCQYRVLSVGKN